MNIAVCYSGQIGAFHKAIGQQKLSFLKDNMDIYAYTSKIVSQKNNTVVNLPTDSRVHDYLIAGKGWRKNTNTYGIVYRIKDDFISNSLKPIVNQIQKIIIEDENLEDTLNDWDMTKWEWLRKRQLWKMYQCDQMVQDSDKKYDIVIRSRFEFGPNMKIDVEDIVSKYKNIDNKIFLFGGWDCVPPMVFMDKFMCDGFAFGRPEVMSKFCSLYLQEQTYPYNPKYKECWEKYGDNVEYQLQEHLKANNIEIIYIGSKRTMYHLWR
jgi:hypothetical protein